MNKGKKKFAIIVSILLICLLFITIIVLSSKNNDKLNEENQSNDELNGEIIDESNEEISSNDELNAEDQSNNELNEDSSSSIDLAEIYSKYQNIKWASSKDELARKLIIENNQLKECINYDWQNQKCAEYKTIVLEGTPIKVARQGNCTQGSYFILTKEGNVYTLDNKKKLEGYKIIDMTQPTIDFRVTPGPCTDVVVYFLTSDGALISSDGALYDEVNPRYIAGRMVSPDKLFYDNDNHIYYRNYEMKNCSVEDSCYLESTTGKYEYLMIKNQNGEPISVKSFYIQETGEYIFIDSNDKFYMINSQNYNILDSAYNGKIVKDVINKDVINEGMGIKITFTDETTLSLNCIDANSKTPAQLFY